MKKLLCMILIGLIAISSVGCGNLNKSPKIEENPIQQKEDNEQLEKQIDDKKSENESSQDEQSEDFSEYQEYVDNAFSCGLLFIEFSNSNYPDEGVCLMALINKDNASEFISDYNGEEYLCYKAEDVEKYIMSKLDMTVDELREKAGYIKEIDAYPAPAGLGGAGCWAVAKDVKKVNGNFEIFYEIWNIDIDIDNDYETDTKVEKLDCKGKLTLSKENKIISNSFIKKY